MPGDVVLDEQRIVVLANTVCTRRDQAPDVQLRGRLALVRSRRAARARSHEDRLQAARLELAHGVQRAARGEIGGHHVSEEVRLHAVRPRAAAGPGAAAAGALTRLFFIEQTAHKIKKHAQSDVTSSTPRARLQRCHGRPWRWTSCRR
eukprot:7387928-Prymnesium_polylepis.3